MTDDIEVLDDIDPDSEDGDVPPEEEAPAPENPEAADDNVGETP